MLLGLYETADERRSLLSEMESVGVKSDIDTWHLIMDSYATVEEKWNVMNEMIDTGLTPDVTTWDRLTSVCTSSTDMCFTFDKTEGSDAEFGGEL